MFPIRDWHLFETLRYSLHLFNITQPVDPSTAVCQHFYVVIAVLLSLQFLVAATKKTNPFMGCQV